MADQEAGKTPSPSAELEKAAVGILKDLGYTVTKDQHDLDSSPITEEAKEAAQNEAHKLVEEMKIEFERSRKIRAKYQETVKSLFKISGWGKPKF